MTERKTIERLTRDILDADEYHACTQKSAKSIAAKLVSVGWQPSIVHQCCEDAEKWRPKVIETVDQLDALPERTVIRAQRREGHSYATYYEKLTERSNAPQWLALDPSDRTDGEELGWAAVILRFNYRVTVLHTPEES